MSQLDAWLGVRLAGWVDGVRERAVAVVWACLLATVVLGVYAAFGLRINSDNLALLSEDIPARRNHAAFAELFPNLESALFVVVDGATPELAREAAEDLEARLAARPDDFQAVYRPGGGEFFGRHGLLYRSVEDLEEFSDRLAGLQPILATLEQDPSIASLSKLVRRGLRALEDQSPDTTQATEWSAVLDRVSQATVDVYREYPVAISWTEVLARGSALETTKRHVLIVHAALDFSSPFAAAAAVGQIHGEALAGGWDAEHGVQVRVTGNPALNFEEMVGIAWDVGLGGVFCFVFVVFVLYAALRSWKLTIAAIATLLVGLVWAAAIAAATVGHLTVVSLSVAILFIGLGVDFAIHLGMRYAQRLRDGEPHADALRGATRDVGSSLVLCTITTAIGFFVFAPTDYVGVAELGVIAGSSMIAVSFLTFTFFPALLSSWLALRGERPISAPLQFEMDLGTAVVRRARAVRWIAAALFVAGLAAIPSARFDPNVIDMRDPDTESVQAFNDLLDASGAASPWYVDAVAADLDAAVALGQELEGLAPVARATTLASYVPADQEEKRELLFDLAFLLESPGEALPGPAPSTESQVEALRDLHAFLEERSSADSGVLAASIQKLRRHLAEFLERVDADGNPEAALARLETLLLANLDRQLERLRLALEPEAVSLESLPRELRERLVAPDGQARVQIFPEANLREENAMRAFTEAVADVAPGANGIAYNLLAFEEATKRSFLQALGSAVLCIGVLLFWLWRRWDDTFLVLAPLFLSAVLSVATMGLLGISFNFVNVIVIPLMFGIGVDSGIHLVHRSRELDSAEGLLGTTTARAVFYSALTTTISFGSLGLSSHVGMAGLGILLSIGMVLTVLSNLVLLPALLALRTEPSSDMAG
ncbi:MAG: MMPL family transporter [Myxococcota bacterium]